MTIKIAINSTHALCTDVKQYFPGLFMNSFNRFQPDKAVWWLTPTNANPSYKFPKLCFMPDERDDTIMLTGLYVEKGLGRSYCEVYGAAKTKKLAIDNSWGWYRIIDEMKNGEISIAFQQIAESTGVKPIVMLSGQYSSNLDFDPYAQRLKAENIYYEVEGAGLREIDYRGSPDKNPLGSLRGVASCSELADRLNDLTDTDFIWIDMVLVLPMQIDCSSTEAVSSKYLSTKVLNYFVKWVTA